MTTSLVSYNFYSKSLIFVSYYLQGTIQKSYGDRLPNKNNYCSFFFL